ncbi:MAG: prenyltransferase/squalene oxidase repeat-containing protein, partial [Candidatus Hodarchaeota archaeon]
MKSRWLVIGIVMVLILVWIVPYDVPVSYRDESPDTSSLMKILENDSVFSTAADEGVPIDWSPFIVLEIQGELIPARGQQWSQVLEAHGVSSQVLTVSELLADPTLISHAPAIIVDASLGSESGSHVSQNLVSLLIREDIGLILTGRAAWMLHLMRERGPPSETALSTNQLLPATGLEGAVYLSSPVPLTIGSDLTTESSVQLPVDPVQTEWSRTVDLTGNEPSSLLASLRYDSWPVDMFLFGCEDPSLLTSQGQGLLVNSLAYLMSLRENPLTQNLATYQVQNGGLLEGGFSYMHVPSISGTYYTVRSVKGLLASGEWAAWKADHQTLVTEILNDLVVDLGSETGFMTSILEGSFGCASTAKGLYILAVMDLEGSFNIPKIVTFLSSRQSGDGGFENQISTTYLVTEALEEAGMLASIDTVLLEDWLRDCVIDGTKTSDPNLWGAIGANPTSISATNHYAYEYVNALWLLGNAHTDPVKLTSWITTRTSQGDGSYRDTVTPGEEITIGTSSALATMEILGTLSSENRTSGLSWLESNQLASGGFGLKASSDDIVGKSLDTSWVSKCIEALGETSGPVSTGLRNYFALCETDVGFEIIEPIPSLMWSSWLMEVSRLSHATTSIEYSLASQYLSYFSQWTQYPFWSNLTARSSPEYLFNQYRTKSVWTQLFGASAFYHLGVEPPTGVVSDAVNYIALSQDSSGHFRPAMFMGTPHVQHSVAAVEALYLLDQLDTVPNRASLEVALLSEYTSGTWNPAGWTLEPFAGQQSAIDWLCTRAAVRLGLIDTSMASEIEARINSRIQYDDILALSCDVSSLALLNSSGLSADLENIDDSLVLSSLGSTPFSSGWVNSTETWQPIYTAATLDMISILGLKPHLYTTYGCTLSITTDASVGLGENLTVQVQITSTSTTHSLIVYSFGEWTKYENVASMASISISAPTDSVYLGPTTVYAMVSNWNQSRAFSSLSLDVTGTLQGSLSLDSNIVPLGSQINGTVIWSLSTEEPAGLSNITVRLGDGGTYQQWTYNDVSPFDLNVPTTDFDSGTYDLAVTLGRQYCTPLMLLEVVEIVAPVPTYINSPAITTGTTGQPLYIDWSLRFTSNGSEIASQVTGLTVRNTLDQVVYSTQDISEIGGSTFTWTPSSRGNFSYIIR